MTEEVTELLAINNITEIPLATITSPYSSQMEEGESHAFIFPDQLILIWKRKDSIFSFLSFQDEEIISLLHEKHEEHENLHSVSLVSKFRNFYVWLDAEHEEEIIAFIEVWKNKKSFAKDQQEMFGSHTKKELLVASLISFSLQEDNISKKSLGYIELLFQDDDLLIKASEICEQHDFEQISLLIADAIFSDSQILIMYIHLLELLAINDNIQQQLQEKLTYFATIFSIVEDHIYSIKEVIELKNNLAIFN